MGQTVKKIGTGVKVGAERKKTAPERRRMKAAGGGKMVPAKEYKARKRYRSAEKKQRLEFSNQLRREEQLVYPLENSRERLLWRGEQEKAGAKTPTASQLLTKKTKPKVSPDYKPQKASGLTRDERRKIKRAGQRLVKDMQKGRERPRSAYEPGMSIAMRGKEKK